MSNKSVGYWQAIENVAFHMGKMGMDAINTGLSEEELTDKFFSNYDPDFCAPWNDLWKIIEKVSETYSVPVEEIEKDAADKLDESIIGLL